MFHEVAALVGQLWGSTIKTTSGYMRMIRVDNDGYLRTLEASTFYPYPGENQSVPVQAVSNRSAVDLTVGETYLFWSTVPCHVRFGNSTVTANGTDPHIPGYTMFEYEAPAATPAGPGATPRIAVIKSTLIVPVPMDGVLSIFRSSR